MKARKAKGLTQRQLAERLGISAGAVAQWETGIARPEQDRLRLLQALLGLPLEDLLRPANSIVPLAGADMTVVELDGRLVEEARDAGIDVAVVLSQYLRGVLDRLRRQRWLEENREAIADANAFLSRHGLWSEGKRQF
jgi:antitoxin CcdA